MTFASSRPGAPARVGALPWWWPVMRRMEDQIQLPDRQDGLSGADGFAGGAPKGSIWLLDAFDAAASTAGGQRDWTRGTYLLNAEQAVGIIEWLSRWNLKPVTTRVVADNAVFKATGSYRGSTAGDFQAARCPLMRPGRMNQREALVFTMLQAAGRDPETPWLLCTKACEG